MIRVVANHMRFEVGCDEYTFKYSVSFTTRVSSQFWTVIPLFNSPDYVLFSMPYTGTIARERLAAAVP